MKLQGEYFEKLSSKSFAATLDFRDGLAYVSKKRGAVTGGMSVQSIQAKRDIHLEDGSLFIAAQPLTEEEFAAISSRFERRLTWFEKFTFKRAVALGALLVLTLIGYRLLLTASISGIVAIFPTAWEREIGENSYEAYSTVAFDPSKLPDEQAKRLRDRAQALLDVSGLDHEVEVLFHQAPSFGANALAFPGGPIVVTDDLVELLSEDQVIAVIAHEIAHIKERHSLHQIVEIVGVSAIAAVLFGASESLIEEASAVAINLWALNKSRDFEREADLVGLEISHSAGLDPSHFAEAIEALTLNHCGDHAAQESDCLEGESGWLSTHPSGAERLEYLRSP